MQAVTYSRYGSPDMLRLAEVPTPEPGDGEVLVRVRAVSLNRSDWEGLQGKPLYARIGGAFRPRRHILGSDIAGRVEAVGRGVTRFRPGEDVFADILDTMGGFAEYVCVSQRRLAAMPPGLDYEQACALPQAGAIALQGIREKGKVQPGQRVLINGAGGGTGMYAVQLAKLDGAEVTGVDNAGKLDFMRSMGADHVVDYTREDFTRTGATYDLILDLAGYRPVTDYRRALAPGGRVLFVGGSAGALLRVLLLGPVVARSGTSIRVLAVRQGADRLGALVELCQAGTVRTVIDRRYRLAEVPEAVRYLGDGKACGKVVVLVP